MSINDLSDLVAKEIHDKIDKYHIGLSFISNFSQNLLSYVIADTLRDIFVKNEFGF